MFAFIACAALVSLCQASPSLSAGSVPALEIGSEAEVQIVLSGADAGLSGYNITCSLADPDMAEITAIGFPDWAGLHQNGPVPAGSVWVEAIDLSDSAETADGPLTLCTLTLKGTREGLTVLKLVPGKVQDDTGETVSLPSSSSSQIVVVGADAGDGKGDFASPGTTAAVKQVETPETLAEPPSLPEREAATATVSLTAPQETPGNQTAPPAPQGSSGPIAVVLIFSVLIAYLIRNLE
jgi:hypothetical protein